MSHKDTRLLKYFKGLILLIKILPRVVDNTFKTLYQPVPLPFKEARRSVPRMSEIENAKVFFGGKYPKDIIELLTKDKYEII